MPVESAFAIGSDDAAPALLGRELLTVEFRRALAHARRQLNTFDGTNLRETLATKDVARSVASDTGGSRVSLLHSGIIPRICEVCAANRSHQDRQSSRNGPSAP